MHHNSGEETQSQNIFHVKPSRKGRISWRRNHRQHATLHTHRSAISWILDTFITQQLHKISQQILDESLVIFLSWRRRHQREIVATRMFAHKLICHVPNSHSHIHQAAMAWKFLNIALMKPQDFLADEIIVSKKLLQQADYPQTNLPCFEFPLIHSTHHVN